MDFWFGPAEVPGVACRLIFGRWQFGVVIQVRAGLSPVKMEARVGEQSGLDEYARVNIIPRAASRSIFGVLYSFVVPNSVVSLQPRSSARIRTTFGLLFEYPVVA